MNNSNTNMNTNKATTQNGETTMNTESNTSAYQNGQLAAQAHTFARNAFRKALNSKKEESIAKNTEIAMGLSLMASGMDLAFKQPKEQDLQSFLDAHAVRANALLARKQSNVLAGYRKGYKDTICASGGKSKNNGDPVALALAGLTAGNVMRAAEILLGMPLGELAEKYGHLNEGQKRMNSGNRIRNGFKKQRFNVADIETAIETAINT